MSKKSIPDDCMPACVSCAFFMCELKEDLGFCHRYPPTIIEIEGDYDSCYPVTSRSDWCGEFVRRVN
jgi:hypothetical protein